MKNQAITFAAVSALFVSFFPGALSAKVPPDKHVVVGEYEGKKYPFETEAEKEKWLAEREASLYHQLGGKAAISAAVDLFYTKVLADEKVNHFFEDVSMRKQHNKQKEFLSAALGGPDPWTGKDMRAAHKDLDLTGEHFGAIAGHLVATLKELKVSDELIDKVISVVATTKDDVLNKEKSAE